MEERPPIWMVAGNILNRQSRTADKEWSSSLGIGRGAETAHRKTYLVTKCSHRKPRSRTDLLAQDRDRWQVLVNALMNLWVP
jgi:hypothetical protein